MEMQDLKELVKFGVPHWKKHRCFRPTAATVAILRESDDPEEVPLPEWSDEEFMVRVTEIWYGVTKYAMAVVFQIQNPSHRPELAPG